MAVDTRALGLFHKGTFCSLCGPIGVVRIRKPALREAALWVPLHARSRLCSVGPSWTDALKPMDPVSSSRCPYNRGGSSRPALSSGWALKGAMMPLLGEDVASWLPVLLILADS